MIIRSPAARALLLLATLASAACSSSGSDTAVVIHVVSDQALGLDRVEMSARRLAGASGDAAAPAAGGAGTTATFPDPAKVTWVITPSGGDKAFAIEVEAKGVGSGAATPVVSQRAVVSFQAGRRVEITMSLAAACVSAACQTPLTCERGACVDPTVIGTPGRTPDGGAGGAGGGGGAGGRGGAGGGGGNPNTDGGGGDGATDGPPADVPPEPKALGQACTANTQCASTHCVDSVCCNDACAGSCQQCNTTAMPGMCVAVAAGQPAPSTRAACATDAPSTCKQTGLCDGKGACAVYADGQVCSAGACNPTANTLTESRCDGMGTCKPGTPVGCAPFRCKAGDTQCARTCVAASDCDGQPCLNGSCGKLKVGATCTADAECELGFCTDGVCCNVRCNGQCQACNLSTSIGTCSALRSGQPVGGRAACAGSGTCGGSCAGQTTCTYPDTSVSCRAASCDVATLTAAASCNGAGACPAVSSSPCQNQLRCRPGATTCLTQCASSADCVSGYYCTAGNACAPLKAQGQPCAADGECATSQCADGVCCNRDCGGSCEACNVSGNGSCTFVTGAPRAGHPACAGGGTGACAQTCRGSLATCSFPGAETSCRSATCSAATQTQTAAANCDGAGNCPAASTKACAPFVCGATACNTTCTSSTQCASGAACVSGACAACAAGTTACPTACANLMTDAANCGACGHSCQGGTCAGGVCQPLGLLTAPVTPIFLLVSSHLTAGNIYAFVGTGVGSGPYDLWRIPTSGPTAGTKVCANIPNNGDDIAVGNGLVFWSQPAATQGFDIVSSPLTACTPASPRRLFAAPRSLGTDWVVLGPYYDAGSNEVFWLEQDNFVVNQKRLVRCNTDGTNVRTMTMYSSGDAFPSIMPPTFSNPSRLFWGEGTLSMHTLFFLETGLAGATPVALTVNGPGPAPRPPSLPIMANASNVIWMSSASTPLSYIAPLPGGVPGTGVPARFPNASVTVGPGVVDATTFYGKSTSSPGAITKCTIASCTPTVLVAGQDRAQQFHQDATSIYWLSTLLGVSPTSPSSLTVTKLAK